MKILPIVSLTLLLPALVLADPVDQSLVTTFQAGQPACAADVNQTIQALVTAANDNAARIAELEAQLRQIQRPLDAKVTGSTYKIFSYEAALGEVTTTQAVVGPGSIVANTHGRLGHWSFIETGTLTLNSNGTASLAFDSFEREVYIDTFATHDVDSPTVPDIRLVDFSTPIDDAETGSDSGTWSITGQEITLTIDGDVLTLIVSADGNILMTGGGALETAGNLSLLKAGMAMAVRTNPANVAVETFDGVPIPDNGPSVQFVAAMGGQVTQSIRILNLGDADLTNMSIVINGSSNFQIVKGLDGPTLGASPGQVLMEIQFADGQGPNSADLVITSDDPDTPMFTVNLSGVVQ